MKYTIEYMRSWEIQKQKTGYKPYDIGYNNGLHEAIEQYCNNYQNKYDKDQTITDLKNIRKKYQNDCCNRSQGKVDAINAVLSKIHHN